MERVFNYIYEYLTERGHKPRLHILDNQCSKAIKKLIKRTKTKYQLVEPHNHRVNAAEPAVKAVKYHMLATFATMDL